MTTIIQDVKAELVKLKDKVDEAIAHIESGVNNLNEDQLGKGVDLVEEIAEAANYAEGKIKLLLKKQPDALSVLETEPAA